MELNTEDRERMTQGLSPDNKAHSKSRSDKYGWTMTTQLGGRTEFSSWGESSSEEGEPLNQSDHQ